MAISKKSRWSRYFCLAFTLIFLALYWPAILGMPVRGIFAHAEDVWSDSLFRWRRAELPTGDPRIIVAALDEETGKQCGFPVPRDVLARLLDQLKAYGVKTVAFDMFFFEPRPGDRELEAAMKRFGKVIHAFAMERKETGVGTVISIDEPIPALKKASQYLGYANIERVLDPDGHVRRAVLFDTSAQDLREPGAIAPSLEAAVMASFLDQPMSLMRARYSDPTPRYLLVNFRRYETRLRHQKRDSQSPGKIQNPDTVDSSYQHISALDLLKGELTDQQKIELRGAIVIVGATSLGYFDHYPNPFDPVAPGLEYHANNLDNMMHDDFLRATPRLFILLVLLAAIWLPLFLLRFAPVVGNAATAGVLALWLGVTYWRFCHGVRTDFVAPAVALALSFLVLTVRRVLTESAQKKYIQHTFGQFVSPEVVEKLVADPGLVKLGGEKREMTVLFLDIAHFTTISEKMSPEALILFLNKYLSALSQVIHDHKGTVDKYIGDCIMAFWNAPLDDPDHRAHACAAAVECQKKMAELNKDLDPSLPEVPAIRIGLNAGVMTVGLTGSEKKLAYTVIGDEVNLGSRLEGANKFFGSHIMASEAAYDRARTKVAGRELGRVRVVGKAIPIKVYELLVKTDELSAQWREALPLYEAGIEHFCKREFDQAAVCFEGVIKIFPKDGPAAFYLNVSRDYSAIPPGPDWDGVIKLTAK